MLDFPVYHQLLGLAQIHVHRVGDAVQPSHPLSSPSPAFSLCQHQSFPRSQFFTSGGQSIGVSASASILPMNIGDWFDLAVQFNSVQSLSRVRLSVTPWTAAHQAPRITNSQSLLKLMSIKPVMPSNHLILCCPLLPSIFPSIRVVSSESALHIRGPKDWSFTSSISPSNEYSGLISFRMDCLDLLAVQGTLKSLP